MLTQPFILMSILSIHVFANTEANENKKLNQTEAIEEKAVLDSKLDPLVDSVTNEKNNLAQTQRQKRYGFFDFAEFPFDLRNPAYPSNTKRVDSDDNSAYGESKQLHVIQKRLQDILTVTKRQYLPPRPVIQPTFVPIFYVPSVRCFCNPATQVPPSTPSNKPQPKPQTPIPPKPTITNEERPLPEFPNRMSGDVDSDDYDDGVRPISFKPIPSNKPLSRPSPPVEHGTVQAGAEPSQTGTSTSNQNPILPPTAQFDSPVNAFTPSQCDKAILRCCHQSRVDITCFKVENCPNPPFQKSLCESDVLTKVVNKFIEYLKQTQGT